MSSPEMQILLPTYNGARYLPALLESLCAQTHTDFSLLTYDDSSTDESATIVNSFSGRLTIRRIENSGKINRGAAESFMFLIDHSDAECILFCDQDDIWRHDKVEKLINRYTELLHCYGDIPLCLFSDLSMFKGENEVIHESFRTYNGTNIAAIQDPYYLVFKNPAPGCTMLCNRLLLKRALPIDPAAYIHDWWLIISASFCGKIAFIDEPLINYRIHDSNTVGVLADKPLPVFLSIFTFSNPAKLSSVVSRQCTLIRNGSIIFRRYNRRFHPLLFWVKSIAGRYLMPTLSHFNSQWKKYSWRSPGV